jgi:tryptophan synthase alpha chain
MAHVVAGYPDASGCMAAVQGLVEGGASYLEVQIPFSDPSADGPAIQNACAQALAKGYSVAQALDLIAELHTRYPNIPLFVMAYASIVVTPGVETFVRALARRGVSGIIVPDLPFDADEGLDAACRHEGTITSIPVAAPSMRAERLAHMAALGRPYLYAALRTGITGKSTCIDEETLRFLLACSAGGSRVLGGFGIRAHAQARAVARVVHAVVVGSAFVEVISHANELYHNSPHARDEAIRTNLARSVHDIVSGSLECRNLMPESPASEK